MATKRVLQVAFGCLVAFAALYPLFRNLEIGPLILRDEVDRRPDEPSFAEQRLMIDALEQRLEVNPSDPRLLTDLADLHMDIADYAEDAGYYERALALAPDDVSLRTLMGTAMYLSDRPLEAMAEFERALEMDPAHPQALFNMGVVLLESRRDVDGAIRHWERLIAMNPGYPQNAMVQAEIDRLRGGE